VCHNVILSQWEKFRIIISDLFDNIYVFSILASQKDELKCQILKLNLNENGLLVENDVLGHVKNIIVSKYPQIDTVSLLGNNEFIEVKLNIATTKFELVQENVVLSIPKDDLVENQQKSIRGTTFLEKIQTHSSKNLLLIRLNIT